MSRYRTLTFAALLVATKLAFTVAETQAEAAFGYTLETDVVYGQGVIAPNGLEAQRDLMLDVYAPSDPGTKEALPAVILVHGGAYHRGGRRKPPYREAGARHSSMEDYARLLSPLGYVCFVVEYRLAPELPLPELTPDSPDLLEIDEVITTAGLNRTNFARRAMGLSELSEDEKIVLWNAAMASAEDIAKAVEFVRRNARTYKIDPERIALGGHSAGAGTSLNVAFGLKAPVAAVFPLSPPEMIFDKVKAVDGDRLPPTLMMISQFDDPAILETAPGTISRLKEAGVDYQFAWVPGFPHFYPAGAVSLADDGTRTSVGERIADFLDEHLKRDN